jgi:outer membrane protein OmpA-like peptidoglycan-associated protein
MKPLFWIASAFLSIVFGGQAFADCNRDFARATRLASKIQNLQEIKTYREFRALRKLKERLKRLSAEDCAKYQKDFAQEIERQISNTPSTQPATIVSSTQPATIVPSTQPATIVPGTQPATGGKLSKILIKSRSIRFRRGNSSLAATPEGGEASPEHPTRAVLNELTKDPNICVNLEGHASNDGNQNKNSELSQKRAEAVRTFLLRGGVEPERISIMWSGADKPYDPGSSESAARLNRRVDMTFQECQSPPSDSSTVDRSSSTQAISSSTGGTN